jgi:hypothetical protein
MNWTSQPHYTAFLNIGFRSGLPTAILMTLQRVKRIIDPLLTSDIDKIESCESGLGKEYRFTSRLRLFISWGWLDNMRRNNLMKKKLYNDELYNCPSSLDIVCVIEWKRARQTGYVAFTWKMKNPCMFAGKREGKRPLEERKSKWHDNVETDLKLGCEVVDRNELSQDTVHWTFKFQTQQWMS